MNLLNNQTSEFLQKLINDKNQRQRRRIHEVQASSVTSNPIFKDQNKIDSALSHQNNILKLDYEEIQQDQENEIKELNLFNNRSIIPAKRKEQSLAMISNIKI